MPDSIRRSQPAPQPSHYEILQVSPQASLEVIRAAFRTLARSNHPDINRSPRSSERMRQINVAYRTLSDPTQRAAYDAQQARANRALQRVTPRSPVLQRHVGTASGRARTGLVSRAGPPVRVRLARLVALAFAMALAISIAVLVAWLITDALDDRSAGPRSATGAVVVQVHDSRLPLRTFH